MIFEKIGTLHIIDHDGFWGKITLKQGMGQIVGQHTRRIPRDRFIDSGLILIFRAVVKE